MPAKRLPGAQPSPLALQRAPRRLPDPPALRSGSRAWLRRPGAPRACRPGGGGTRRRGAGRAKPGVEGPTRGGRHAATGPHAGRARRATGCEGPGRRAAPSIVRGARAEARAPPAAGMTGACPAAREARTEQRRGRGPRNRAGESGRRAAPRRREARAGTGAGAEDAAGLQGKARGGAAARSGPRRPPESARRDAATSLGHGAAGTRPAPAPPPGQPLGPEPRSEGARTGESGRPQPALTGPRLRRRRRGCAPSSMVPPRRGRPAPPPRTTPHAAAPATPPPARPRPRPRPLSAGGPAGARGGLSAGSTNRRPLAEPLHQDWRAPQPMGKWKERGASAPRGGGLRRRWLSRSVLRPRLRMRIWPESASEWRGGVTFGRVYHQGPFHRLCYRWTHCSPFEFPPVP